MVCLLIPTFNPGFMGNVSSNTLFLLEAVCEEYLFLDQAVANLDNSMDSILTDSIETSVLDSSFDELDVVTSLVSSGFLHSVLLLKLLKHSLLLVSDVLGYGSRLWHFIPVCLWPPRCQHLNCFDILLVTQYHLGSSFQHHQITSP